VKVTSLKQYDKLRFEFVGTPELRSVWDLIGPDVELVRKRSRGTWSPEHVFALLYNGGAILQLAYIGEVYAGFVVLVINVDVFSGDRSLVVWLLFSRIPSAFDEGFALVEQLAREYHCSRIILQSPRRGWIRRLAPFGFRVRDYVMEKEVPNG